MPSAKVELFLNNLMGQDAVRLKPIHRYKDICAMLEMVTEVGFNITYGRLKTKYVHNIGVLKYVEKD